MNTVLLQAALALLLGATDWTDAGWSGGGGPVTLCRFCGEEAPDEDKFKPKNHRCQRPECPSVRARKLMGETAPSEFPPAYGTWENGKFIPPPGTMGRSGIGFSPNMNPPDGPIIRIIITDDGAPEITKPDGVRVIVRNIPGAGSVNGIATM